MRIGYLSYVNPFAWSGGGEMVGRALITAGRAEHDVQVFALWPEPCLPAADGVTAWVVVDLNNIPARQARLDQRALRRVPRSIQHRFHQLVLRAMNGPFVHLDNAYVDVCHAAYLPCGPDDVGACPRSQEPSCHWSQGRLLYERARGCFFVSPLHAEMISRIHPVARERAQVLRPLLDPQPFIDARRSDRDIEHLFVGVLSEAKGLDALRRIDDLVVVTPYPPAVALPNAQIVVGVPPADMPAFFGRSRTFVFHSRWPEPFGRVVAEAALAGCRLEVTGLVGALSFGIDPARPELYAGAAEEFWRTTEELVA
jgi:glycosyltransferase involved in cell wall biosynthesis